MISKYSAHLILETVKQMFRNLPLTNAHREKYCKTMNNYNQFNVKSSAKSSGPRLNIKTVLSTYGDFHVKDKTAVRTSYL